MKTPSCKTDQSNIRCSAPHGGYSHVKPDDMIAVFESAADAIMILDGDGLIRTFNHAAETLFGLQRKDVLGRHSDCLIRPQQRPRFRRYLQRRLRYPATPNGAAREEFEALHNNGDPFPIDLAVSAIQDPAQRLFLGIIRDDTDRKLTQQRLREAESASQAKAAFLAGLSHELRTPMNAIMGFAQLLLYNQQHPLQGIQTDSVRQIISGSRHLLELMDQILELHKVEAGNLSVNLTAVTLHDIISECVLMILPKAAEAEIEIIDDISGHDLPCVWTDSTRLKQVLLNLLSNAVKYNRVGGKVTLSRSVLPNGIIRIEVADTGLGIPKERHQDVFKPFNRLGREAGTIDGTGIGLSISKQIMKLLSASIGFESEPDVGSRFWIELPVDKTTANANVVDIFSVRKDQSHLDCHVRHGCD